MKHYLQMKPIRYAKQEVTDDDISSVIHTLKSDFLTQGPNVELFEKNFASVVGSKFAVACSSGTAALHLTALSLDVNDKSHFIIPSITFAASANCIQYCGGQVSFCDIDPITGLMDFVKLQNMILGKPKGYYTGIIPVDFAGFPVNMKELKSICDPHGLAVIQDACHALGAYFHGSKDKKETCGASKYADASVFSFHPAKHITTGEGGMITTNNEELYERLKLLRTHGITKDQSHMESVDGPWSYDMQELGYNYRLPDILCALGISQLQRLSDNLDQRYTIAKRYDEAFFGHSDIKPLTPAGVEDLLRSGIFHANHLYVIQTSRRRELYDYLVSKNIFCQVHYIPIYKLAFYQRQDDKSQNFPEAENYYNRCLSIPMYPSLLPKEQAYVIQNILDFF